MRFHRRQAGSHTDRVAAGTAGMSSYVNTRSPSPALPLHCAIATVFVALPKAWVKLGFAL
jgi:hypothetical protein